MRRILLAVAVLGATFVAAPASAQTVKLITSQTAFINASNPPVNSGFLIFGGIYREETVGGPTIDYNTFNVNVFDGIGGFAFASGPLNFDFDPALMTGTIQGTVGTITVNVSFLASELSTNPPPVLSAEVVPTPPQQATVQAAFSRFGRVNGTVASPQTGPITGTNAGGYVSRYNAIQVRT